MHFIFALLGNYFRLMLFAIAVMLGAQVPGFIAQYETVVRAHKLEASLSLQGFENTAKRYFDGNIQRLIAHYKQSNDAVFVDDAENIQTLVSRVLTLEAESNALKQNPLMSAWHIVLRAGTPLFDETLTHYNWVIPIKTSTLFWGFALALFILLILDSCWFAGSKILKLASTGKRSKAKESPQTQVADTPIDGVKTESKLD